jgi:serpin B
MAHDVFLQNDLKVAGPFLDTLSSQYDSGIGLVDFKTRPRAASDLINAWVVRETKNRVQNLLSPAVLTPDTRFVLLSAMYLYASWRTPFDPNLTAPQTFHGTDRDASVPFMVSTLDTDYARGADWSGVDIPYFGDSLVFTAILPDPDHFGSVKASLDARWFGSYDQSHTRRAVALTVPKFKIAGPAFSWIPTLKSMGINALFDQTSCDLSGITRDQRLFVDDVLQQTFIEVAEKGTEAAAATAVVGVKASADSEQPISFILDRPFLFFVREPMGPILFAGQVTVLPGTQ